MGDHPPGDNIEFHEAYAPIPTIRIYLGTTNVGLCPVFLLLLNQVFLIILNGYYLIILGFYDISHCHFFPNFLVKEQ